MPVYEQTYQHYTGVFRPRSQSWMVITSTFIKKSWGEKGFKIMLFFFLLPFLVALGQIYLAANRDLMEWMGWSLEDTPQQVRNLFIINETFYYSFLQNQQLFCFIMALFVGSDIIAGDRRTKALTLYLSKPLSRLDYLFGKGAVVLFYLYCITLFPAWLLMFLNAFLTDNWLYLLQNIPMALKIFLFSNIMVLPLVFAILAFSSTTKQWVTAASMLGVIYFLPPILVEILENILRSAFGSLFYFDTWKSALSFQSSWEKIGSVIFNQETDITLHWYWHLKVLVTLCLLFSWILYRRIQAVEVVK